MVLPLLRSPLASDSSQGREAGRRVRTGPRDPDVSIRNGLEQPGQVGFLSERCCTAPTEYKQSRFRRIPKGVAMQTGTRNRGFASMDAQKQREIARKGG